MKNDNPFRLKEMSADGPYILGDEQCTDIRAEYIRRGNNILRSYATLATMSNIGLHEIVKQIKIDETPMRLTLGKRLIQCQLRTLKINMPNVTRELTNQWAVLIYGNFEAYIVDLLVGAFKERRAVDPEQESLNILACRGWEGKIDYIGQKLQVTIGKSQFAERFKNIRLEFQGKLSSNPIVFLQKTADLRHLIAHSSGRISENLAKDYPNSGLKAGDMIQFPVEFPFDLHLFLVTFTDVFDGAFSKKYGWKRKAIRPASLV